MLPLTTPTRRDATLTNAARAAQVRRTRRYAENNQPKKQTKSKQASKQTNNDKRAPVTDPQRAPPHHCPSPPPPYRCPLDSQDCSSSPPSIPLRAGNSSAGRRPTARQRRWRRFPRRRLGLIRPPPRLRFPGRRRVIRPRGAASPFQIQCLARRASERGYETEIERGVLETRLETGCGEKLPRGGLSLPQAPASDSGDPPKPCNPPATP